MTDLTLARVDAVILGTLTRYGWSDLDVGIERPALRALFLAIMRAAAGVNAPHAEETPQGLMFDYWKATAIRATAKRLRREMKANG